MKIRCDLRIQNLQSALTNNQEKLHKSCMLGLYRPRPDDSGHVPEIILTIESKSFNSKYKLNRIETYTKFINEGKATLKLVDENVFLMLSNCPSLTLINFVSFLNAKMIRDKHKSVALRNKENMQAPNSSKAFATRLLERAECKLGPSQLKNISPLCQQDINAITQKRSLQQSLESPLSGKFAPTKIEKQASFSSMVQLTSEQKQILSIIKEGKNVFFTGSGGTGKSFLLNLAKKCFPVDSCFVTASTGCAAALIGGLTLHAFSGFTLPDGDDQNEDFQNQLKRICDRIVSSKEKLNNWKKCKQLIIDEISMIDAHYFDFLEAVARSIKNTDLPFGGIQLIICGDFLQLPPVSKHGSEKKKFCFQAKSWIECIDTVVNLTQIKRQKDARFIEMLEEIRFGKCSQKTIDILEKSKSRVFSDESIFPTRLCTHKEDVEFINQKELDSLPSNKQRFKSIDDGDLSSPNTITKLLNFLCPAREDLYLKVGAQVMLIKNLDVAAGLVNGARGCVVRFEEERHAPVVRFMSGAEVTVRVEMWSFKVNAAGLMVTRRQLPLQLAWAISIHKSQGMTLDCVEISLSRVFEFGQAYVALSRAKSLDSLRIIDFDANSIKANEDVIKFYQSMSLRKSNKLFMDEDDDEY